MAGPKHALLVCISKYCVPPPSRLKDLAGVLGDQRRSEICLADLGFTVTSLADHQGFLTGDNLHHGVAKFLDTVAKDFKSNGQCTVVIVISSHGRERHTEMTGTVQEVIASDGKILNVNQDLVQNLNRLQLQRPTELKCIFILDCCRENRNDRTFTKGTPLDTKWDLQHDFYFIFACDPGRKTNDTPVGGVVVSAVMKLLKYRVPITVVFDQAMRDAEKLDPGQQRAWVYSHAKGLIPTLGWKTPPAGIFDTLATGPEHELSCEGVQPLFPSLENTRQSVSEGILHFELEHENLTDGLLRPGKAHRRELGSCCCCKKLFSVAAPFRVLLLVLSGFVTGTVMLLVWADRGSEPATATTSQILRPSTHPTLTTSTGHSCVNVRARTTARTSTVTTTPTSSTSMSIPRTSPPTPTSTPMVPPCPEHVLNRAEWPAPRLEDNVFTPMVQSLNQSTDKEQRHVALLSLAALVHRGSWGEGDGGNLGSMLTAEIFQPLLGLAAWGEPNDREEALHISQQLIWMGESLAEAAQTRGAAGVFKCLLPFRGPLRDGAICGLAGLMARDHIQVSNALPALIPVLLDEPEGDSITSSTLCTIRGVPAMNEALSNLCADLPALNLSRRLVAEQMLYELDQRSDCADMVKQLSSDSDAELAVVLAYLTRLQPAKITEADGLQSLVQCLARESSTVQRRAANVLSNLATKQLQNREVIAKAGAIQPLLHLLANGTDRAARVAAADTLCKLTGDSENAFTIAQAGALPFILDLAPDPFARSPFVQKLRGSSGMMSGAEVAMALLSAGISSHVQFCTTDNPGPPSQWCMPDTVGNLTDHPSQPDCCKLGRSEMAAAR